jgi:hypothetical protein
MVSSTPPSVNSSERPDGLSRPDADPPMVAVVGRKRIREAQMRKIMLVAMLVVMGLSTLAFGSPGVNAEERRCTGRIGATTLDNVRVPSGSTCTLEGTYVKGSVYVSSRATLRVVSARIIGNIQSEGHAYVRVSGTTRVGGSIQLKQGVAFLIDSARVAGSIQVTSNYGSSRIARNIVNADVQVFSHGGGIAIGSNRIDGNLQCKGNSPAPTGSGNIVQGNKEDQCRRL